MIEISFGCQLYDDEFFFIVNHAMIKIQLPSFNDEMFLVIVHVAMENFRSPT
jgi:hypothetical protein